MSGALREATRSRLLARSDLDLAGVTVDGPISSRPGPHHVEQLGRIPLPGAYGNRRGIGSVRWILPYLGKDFAFFTLQKA